MNSETKTHSQSSVSATCQNCKNQFVIEPDDFAFYEKMGVLPPARCPKCRFLLRAMFRNETTLYSRTCDLCKKQIISMFNPKSPYVVYCNQCWDSDKWDPFSYGVDYDPARPFFDQLAELFLKVPKKAMFLTTTAGQNINSDYSNGAGGVKNCYLVFNTGNSEDVLYSRGLRNCRDSADLYYGSDLERCYEGVNVQFSNGVQFGQNVSGSVDSIFVMNGSGLQNCFGCVNLRNKRYHFFNEPLSKPEYEKRTADIRGSYAKMEEMKGRFEDFSLKLPRRENTNLKTVDSVGDYLLECKRVYQGFEITESEDCRYVFSVKDAKDCYDTIGYGWGSELLLECQGVGKSQRVIGSYWVEESRNIEYSWSVRSSEDCFGVHCVKHAQHVILNKKYSEEEYGRVREQIIRQLTKDGEYGSFFPVRIAPFAYNETVAQDNFSLTKENAIKAGFRWEDDIQVTRGKETIRPEQLPDHIKEIQDSITNEVLACLVCDRNYRITPAELTFYRKMILPIPRRCFFCRHQDRIRRRGPIEPFSRSCARCNKKIMTTYAPNRPEIVYCEACYQQEVV